MPTSRRPCTANRPPPLERLHLIKSSGGGGLVARQGVQAGQEAAEVGVIERGAGAFGRQTAAQGGSWRKRLSESWRRMARLWVPLPTRTRQASSRKTTSST